MTRWRVIGFETTSLIVEGECEASGCGVVRPLLMGGGSTEELLVAGLWFCGNRPLEISLSPPWVLVSG